MVYFQYTALLCRNGISSWSNVTMLEISLFFFKSMCYYWILKPVCDAALAVVDNALALAVKNSGCRIPRAIISENHKFDCFYHANPAYHRIRLIEVLEWDRSVYSHRASHKQTLAFRFTSIILRSICWIHNSRQGKISGACCSLRLLCLVPSGFGGRSGRFWYMVSLSENSWQVHK